MVAVPTHVETAQCLLPQHSVGVLPPTLTVQAIEPLPAGHIGPPFYTASPEEISTPSGNVYFEGPGIANFPPGVPTGIPPGNTSMNPADPTIIYEGTPDAFPTMMDSMGGPGPGCSNCGNCQECQQCAECWTWQILPTDIIYHSYLAGPKEPRFAAIFWHDTDLGWNLDYTVGGRVGLVRYGTTDHIWPQGWELDLEGAAFPRVNLDQNMDLDAADYRVGIPLTYGKDKWQAKLEVYHLSAHVGDEYLIRHPSFERINYVRDSLVAGISYYPVNMVRVYGEAEWGFNLDGGAKPWAFQFGCEVSPLRYNGCGGDPFLALNTSLRQDVDFGGNLNLQAGWQWRGYNNRRLLRAGFHYLVGKSNQFEFYSQNESQLGAGVWYDF